MNTTIVNLRGTSGAGKSTVAHTLLARNPFKVVEERQMVRGPKPLVYKLSSLEGVKAPLFIFGAYHTQCGGCDGIMGYQFVVPELLDKYAGEGHILFEGLLISGGFGRVGEAMAKLQTKRITPVWALLDTPLEKCLERIGARRLARGKTEPLNPENTAQKHNAAWKSHDAILARGLRAEKIRHQRSYSDVLKLFGVTVAREPKHARVDDHA
jgi:predicted kinase